MSSTKQKLTLSGKQAFIMKELVENPQVVESLIGGSAGGGKSISMCIIICMYAMKYPGIQFVLGRKTLQALKRSTVATLLGKVHPMFNITKNDFRYSQQDNVIEYKNGSKITLVALDYEPSDPDFARLGSLEFDWAFIDEAGEITEQAKNVLRSRLGRGIATQKYGLKPFILSGCNPSQNYLRKEYYMPYKRLGGGEFQKWQIGEIYVGGKKMPAYRCFLRMSVRDNPFVDRNYVETLKQLPDRERRRLLDGDWDYSDSDNMLFTNEVVEEATLDRMPDLDVISRHDYLIGVDVADVGCFDDKTEVLTDNGWKLFADVNGSDKILTQNPVTGIATFENHDGIHCQHYNGLMWNYDSPKISFSVTPNHKMLCRQASKLSGNTLRSIEDIPWKEWKLVRTHRYKNTKPLQDTFLFTSTTEMPHGGVRKKTWNFTKKDWFAFLGWFISEGCVIQETRGRLKINIAQKQGTEKSDIIERLLTDMGIKHTHIGNNFIFYNNSIAHHLLLHVGKYASQKRIPNYVTYSDDREAVNAFLDAYCNGDGCWRKGHRLSYFSSSRYIIDSLQIMLANINAAGKITTAKKAGTTFEIDGRKAIRKHDVYCINENHPTRDFTLGRHTQIRQEPYDGEIYCAITKYHTMFVRRNGTCYWTGNTDSTCISIVQNKILVKQIKINLKESGIGKNSQVDVGEFLAQKVINTAKRLGLTQNDAKRITIEINGVGASLRDALRRHEWQVNEYVAQMKTRGKLYYSLSEMMIDGKVRIFNGSDVDYEELRRQLTAHTYEMDGDTVKVCSKKELRRLLGCSPDLADSFAISLYPMSSALKPIETKTVSYVTRIRI